MLHEAMYSMLNILAHANREYKKAIDPNPQLMENLEQQISYNRQNSQYFLLIFPMRQLKLHIFCRTKLCACDLLRNLPNMVVFQS
jgi:hypothetical protein